MPTLMDAAAEQRLAKYLNQIGDVLDGRGRRESFAVYALGIFSDAERKSIEPIAARACPDPAKMEAAHQRLLHFAADSPWSDRAVRRAAARYGVNAMTQEETVEAWIIDDTGFLKQGKHSVGVQRQYTGSAGKVTNCQIGVSLTVATRTEQLPIDFALYLPESWLTKDRRREARIPDEVVFKTKPELALDLIHQAVVDGVPPGLVLADAAFGTSRDFRDGIRELGLHYAVAVNPNTVVSVVDKRDRLRDEVISVQALAQRIESQGGFRRCTWREGTKQDLSAQFALRRVVAAYDHAVCPLDKRETLSLLIEWRDGEDEPANYFLCSLPKRWTRKKLVRLVMQRWRTERAYQDLKGELGLDHYEGRRFQGWHHHISVVLCCYAFIVAERVRHFPPSAGDALGDFPQSLAA
jgi:SRSO17 transposase